MLDFIKYLSNICRINKRLIFGDIGLFTQGSMICLLHEERIYLRGGDGLDQTLRELNCEQYHHVKSQNVVKVNYYDITDLFKVRDLRLEGFIRTSIKLAIEDKLKAIDDKRLRGLPNMNFTLERMLKKWV